MQFFNDEDFSWRILAVEAVVIMLSVLLGFTLNGWRQSASEQETVDAALQSIAAEVQQNRSEMIRHLPYYRTMRDTLRYLAQQHGDSTIIQRSDILGFRGIKIPLLRSSAFETARSTGALSNMEFRLADALSSTYDYQRVYNGYIDNLTRIVVTDGFASFETIRDWSRMFTLLYNNGVSLMGKNMRGAKEENPRITSYPALLDTLSERHGVEVAPLASTDSTRAVH